MFTLYEANISIQFDLIIAPTSLNCTDLCILKYLRKILKIIFNKYIVEFRGTT